MPARLLSLPFVIGALFFLFLTWEYDEGYSVYIVPFVLILAIIYVFSPQINWWWYVRNPPSLDGPIRMLLDRHHSFYGQLSPEEQERFRHRVALFTIGHDFMGQAMEEVPEDIKAVAAINAVHLTFWQEDFLLEPFEKIVVYPKPFPSPQFPEHFHASEVFEEDGVVLFSAEQLMHSYLHPGQFYNIGLHEFAKVYIHLHPEKNWPDLEEADWQRLERVSGFKRELIVKWINLPEPAVSLLPVCVTHYFTFPVRFQEELPEVAAKLTAIFKKSPEPK